ncbi:MAG: hypothetical protein EOM72_03825 [Opitutae bacterium]|nr:hypothetical protein [Opitutae bacterium]
MNTDPARWLCRAFLSVVAALVLGLGGSGCGGDSDGDGGGDGADHSGLSGVWDGVSENGSRQTFTLTVSRNGAIRGSMLDKVNGQTYSVTGEVDGNRIVMDSTFPDHYEGTVTGNTIRGTMTNLGVSNIGVAVPWTATKK